jgi:hypothetical protein
LDGLARGAPVPDYFAILAKVVIVMEQQVGYKTGHKPGSRFQNSFKSFRHQEKDNPSSYSVSVPNRLLRRDNLPD